MWLRAPFRPATIHIVNLQAPPSEVPAWMRVDQGDACALSDAIASGKYDLVFSNSVLEHVGGHAQRARFADNVHALSTRHWVQTPYRYFPVEPHWLSQGFQFLPLSARAEWARSLTGRQRRRAATVTGVPYARGTAVARPTAVSGGLRGLSRPAVSARRPEAASLSCRSQADHVAPATSVRCGVNCGSSAIRDHTTDLANTAEPRCGIAAPTMRFVVLATAILRFR